MYTNNLEGFNTLKFSEEIEMPNLIDCINSPFLFRANVEDAYKYGGEVNRYFIDRVNISKDTKHVLYSAEVRFLKPGFCPISTHAWHSDGSQFSYACDDIHHIYIGDSSSLMTQYLEDEIIINDNDTDINKLNHMELRGYFEKNKDRFNFKSKEGLFNRFTTFNSKHIHRVLGPTKPEFRFCVQIRESSVDQSTSFDKANRKYSKVFKMDEEKILNLEEFSTNSIEKSEEYGIIIRNKY